MPYIFGKLWHLAIIWPIRKAFHCILQGVRFLLANQTPLSPTSDNDSYVDILKRIIHFKILQELPQVTVKWGLNVSHVPPVFLVFFSHPCILCLSCFLCILRVSFPFFLSHLPSTSTISILRYLIISMQKLWNWAKKAKSGRTWQIWPRWYFKIMAPLGSF